MDDNGNPSEFGEMCKGCGLPMPHCVCEDEEEEEFDLIGD